MGMWPVDEDSLLSATVWTGTDGLTSSPPRSAAATSCAGGAIWGLPDTAAPVRHTVASAASSAFMYPIEKASPW